MIAQIRILSLNCNGLGDRVKRKRLFRHLIRRNIDVALLQETHTNTETSQKYEAEWKRLRRNHHSLWNSETSRSCGVAILINNKKTIQVINSAKDSHGRIQTIQVSINDNIYQFQSLYAPNNPGSRPLFFEDLHHYLFPDGESIIGGDFNMVEDINLDRVGGTPTSAHEKGKDQLVQLKQQCGLADIWRQKSQNVREYTWSSPNSLIHSRIDRIYLSDTLQPSFLSQTHLLNSFSDHKTLCLTLQLKSNIRRGEGYWKLNVSLLKDAEYRKLIEDFLTEWINCLPNHPCIQTWWIECKNWVKQISIDFSTQQKQLRKRTVKALRKFLKEENSKPTPDKEYIVETEEKIAALEDFRHTGAMIRSREETIIDGEKPTRYFYALESIKKAKSTIENLIIKQPNHKNNPNDDNYIEITNETDILKEIHKYYTELYSKQTLNTALQDELLSKIDRKLPNNIKTQIDAPITKQNLFRAIQLFKRNKSPGIDGLPIEFYDTFWPLLSTFFPKLAEDIYSKGLLPGAQQRISIIALIHKKYDKEFLDNWRPISLLCVDFKIISKVLSLRLKDALPHILGEEQTCAVLGRTIFENLYTLRDVINYTRDHELPGYIVSLDFQKAFDEVDHAFLEKTLRAFGFGQRYTNFIISSLRDCVARVANNGRFTEDIDLQRGIKQGEMESSQIYDVIAEVLAIQVRKNPGIKGLHVPGDINDLKSTLYADDSNYILTTTQSIINLFKELKRFEEASGCNINHKKSLGLTLGDAPIPNLPFPIWWNPPQGVKMLGITFFQDPMKTTKATWNAIIERIQHRAASLSCRALSFWGKRIIINSLLLSKSWHAAIVIPALKEHVDKIEDIIYNYLFNNKTPHKPKEEVLTLLLNDGGIAIKDFQFQQQSLRINRLRLILDPAQKSPWIRLARLYMAADICRWNNDWPFLNSPQVPKIDFHNPENSSLRSKIQPYHRELTNFLRDHKRQFLKLKDPSTANIYKIMLKHRTPRIGISGKNYWNRETERALPWNNIWKTTYSSLDRSHYLDVYYKFLHNAHPTGNNLLQSTTRNYDTKCPTCHTFETTLHTFAGCTFPRTIWNRYFYFYSQMQDTQDITYGDILFSLKLPSDRHKRLLVLTITNIIMSEIWRARCAHKKESIPTDANLSTYKINARIKRIHWAYFKCTHNYYTKLCLPSPICKLDNNQLLFDLPTADSFNIYGEESDLTSDDYFNSDTTATTTTATTSDSTATTTT